MMKIRLITTWVQSGDGMVFDAARLLGAGDSCMDVTGENAPVDSPVVVEVWGCADTLARIQADAGQYVLTIEEVVDETI